MTAAVCLLFRHTSRSFVLDITQSAKEPKLTPIVNPRACLGPALHGRKLKWKVVHIGRRWSFMGAVCCRPCSSPSNTLNATPCVHCVSKIPTTAPPRVHLLRCLFMFEAVIPPHDTTGVTQAVTWWRPDTNRRETVVRHPLRFMQLT